MKAIRLERAYLRAFQYLNRRLKSASLRLTKLTGKSPVPVHPHHLLEVRAEHHWYLAHLKPGDVVLDVGCGNGMHTQVAASYCGRAIGFNYDGGELKRGQHLLHNDVVPNVTLLIADALSNFPFADSSFDAVLFLDVIEHLPDRVVPLREIARVVKPDGQVLISAPNGYTSWKRRQQAAGLPHYSDPDHKVEYSQESLAAELAQGGLRIVSDFEPIVYDTPLAGLIDFIGGLSLSLYRRLSAWKHEVACRHPEESIGWRVVCRRQGGVGMAAEVR